MILVVIPSLRRGGAERVVSLLSQEWAHSHQVKIAVFDSSEIAYAFGGELLDLGLPAQRTYLGKAITMFRRIGVLHRTFRQVRPDLIVSFMEAANLPVLLASLLAGMRNRIVASVHNNPTSFHPLHRFLIPLIYRFTPRIVAVSEGIRQQLLSCFHVPANQCETIPNPVSVNTVRARREAEMNAGHAQFLANEPFFVAVGRLHPQKGFDMLLQAMRKVRDQVPCRLLILGEGQERSALESLRGELGLEREVLMPGIVENPFPYYRRAAAFVLSSRYEGWPMVLPEAMAAGAPIVAFNCPYGPSECLQHGETGLLVPPGDVEQLANSMLKILRDSNLGPSLMAKAGEAVGQYDIAPTARKWLAQGERSN